MAFEDIREYISALDKHGQLKTIKQEVHWNLEAGAIMRLVNEKSLPSPFFQKITGYSPEYRIFGSPLNSFKKLSIALGVSPETSQKELMEIYRQRSQKPVKPILISKKDAPCKENIHLDKDINLLEFPAPMLHDGDGGRYLCTWHIIVTKDPDSGWVNWGMYRAMVHTKSSMGGLIEPSQHIGYHYYRRYQSRKRPMPFAISIGPDPITGYIGSSRIPAEFNEADMVGALRQKPVELVKCETNDLEVPAFSEIVIEGEVSPIEREWEGPFGEYTGYRASPRDKRPVYKVNAITHRNQPILTASCMGMPIDESDIACLARAVEMFNELKHAAIPVVAVNMPPEGVGNLAIVSINVKSANYPHMAERVSSCMWGSQAGTTPYIIVVEDDVDVFNLPMVIHSLVTKCHAWRGIRKEEFAFGNPLTPFLSRYERLNRLGCRASFDCTWPLDWDPSIAVPPRASFDNIYPKEIQEHVLKNWQNYGFEKLP